MQKAAQIPFIELCSKMQIHSVIVLLLILSILSVTGGQQNDPAEGALLAATLVRNTTQCNTDAAACLNACMGLVAVGFIGFAIILAVFVLD